jgi:hypothetical protein
VCDGALGPFCFAEESDDGVQVTHMALKHRFYWHFYDQGSSIFRCASNICDF